MKRIVCAGIVLLFVIVTGVHATVKKDLKLSLRDKQIQNLSTSGLSLVFYVDITNLSSREYFLSGYNYRFVVQDNEFFRLQVPLGQEIAIQPNEKTLISLPVKITYDLLFEEIAQTKEEDSFKCYLMGSFHFSDDSHEKGRIPIAFSGEFPVFKGLETEILPVIVNDLTIGGADLMVRLCFKNRNVKDIAVVNMDYEIKVGERAIAQGSLPDDIHIPGKQEMILEIPVLISFFDVGKDIYSFLKQDSAPFHIILDLELVTPWDRFSHPIDIIERISLEKSKEN